MMRSKFLLVALLFGVVVHAATPNAYFLKHRDEILSGKITQGAGVEYGVGRATQASASATSQQIAKGKSELIAKGGLLRRVAMGKLRWPENLSDLDREVISTAYMKYLTITATVNGMMTLWQGVEDNGCVSVVCLPISEVAKIRTPNFVDVYTKLVRDDVLFSGILPVETLISLRKTQEQLPAEVDRSPWNDVLQNVTFDMPRLARLPQFAGRYPIGTREASCGVNFQQGMQAYQVGNLSKAYEFFLVEAEQTFAYDALNMAGNVARRIGQYAEAVPLLLQAAYLKPTSPHPWVHLAFAAEGLGNLDLAEACCKTVETKEVDSWSLEQITLLRKKMAPVQQGVETP